MNAVTLEQKEYTFLHCLKEKPSVSVVPSETTLSKILTWRKRFKLVLGSINAYIEQENKTNTH